MKFIHCTTPAYTRMHNRSRDFKTQSDFVFSSKFSNKFINGDIFGVKRWQWHAMIYVITIVFLFLLSITVIIHYTAYTQLHQLKTSFVEFSLRFGETCKWIALRNYLFKLQMMHWNFKRLSERYTARTAAQYTAHRNTIQYNTLNR